MELTSSEDCSSRVAHFLMVYLTQGHRALLVRQKIYIPDHWVEAFQSEQGREQNTVHH